MQVVIVLFLVVFFTALGIALFIGASYGFGHYLNQQSGTKAEAGNTDPCAQCMADSNWYQALPGWQQLVAMGWWWVNRVLCSRKGC